MPHTRTTFQKGASLNPTSNVENVYFRRDNKQTKQTFLLEYSE